MARQKQTQQWMSRPRKNSQYWSGMSSDVKGWCIYTRDRTSRYYLSRTGVTKGSYLSIAEAREAARYGPFESFEAAKAAAVIMITSLKGATK